MRETGQDVVVTGVGPVTAVGVGTEDVWRSLDTGVTNVAFRELFCDVARVEALPMASMPPADQVAGLGRHVEFLENQECGTYRDLAYAMLATELALADAGLEYDRDANRIGMIQAFEAPGVEQVVSRLMGLMRMPPPTDAPPQVYELLAPQFYNSQPFMYLHMAAKAFGFHGFSNSSHNACASGAFAVEIAAQQIRAGRADAMVVMCGEAFETAVRLEWFRRLDLYAKDVHVRPFDCASTGICVGEGAAALVLESRAHAEARGADVYAAYLGGAFAQQSWKQTVPDVRAARLTGAIREAMSVSGIRPADLDLVVPHGAAVRVSDGYEAACLKDAINGEADGAVVTAFKPYVGHMLAGSGVIELVCMMLAMKHQRVPAVPDARPENIDLPLPVATACEDRRVRTAVKLSTGFTGHDAALVFQREN